MVTFYGKTFPSRLLIGSALYPSPAIMQSAIRASGSSIVTVSLRRESDSHLHCGYSPSPQPSPREERGEGADRKSRRH